MFMDLAVHRIHTDRYIPYEDTDSFINMKLLSTTCLMDAWMQEHRVGPPPTVLEWESKRSPCSVLKYEAMFSSSALTSGASPVQSIPTAPEWKETVNYQHYLVGKCLKLTKYNCPVSQARIQKLQNKVLEGNICNHPLV